MKKLIVILIILLPLLSGCYNYREINELAIVPALSIAKVDNKFKITVQVINSKKENDASSANHPNFITYENTGDSIQETLRTMIVESPKKIYGAHLQFLILDESLAKDDITDALDFFFRDPEIRKVFYVVVGKQQNLLKVITPLDNATSQNITDSLKSTNKYLGLTNLTTFHDLMDIYLSKKQELALPSLEVIGNIEVGQKEENIEQTNSESSVIISNIAVFKDNKLQGYLTQDESIAYNIIKNNITYTLIDINYDDGYIINEILDLKTSMKAIVKENKIKINIKGTSGITEVTTAQSLNTPKDIENVEEKLNKEISSMIVDSIKNINAKYNSDIYGFQELFYKTDYKYYNKIKDKWYEEIFPNIKVEVTTNITIEEKGNLLGGIYNE